MGKLIDISRLDKCEETLEELDRENETLRYWLSRMTIFASIEVVVIFILLVMFY